MYPGLWNLLAAVLSTLGAAICTAALFLSEPTFVNYLAAGGTAIGVLAGIAWIMAAIGGIRRP